MVELPTLVASALATPCTMTPPPQIYQKDANQCAATTGTHHIVTAGVPTLSADHRATAGLQRLAPNSGATQMGHTVSWVRHPRSKRTFGTDWATFPTRPATRLTGALPRAPLPDAPFQLDPDPTRPFVRRLYDLLQDVSVALTQGP
jgi:hypothetical protein